MFTILGGASDAGPRGPQGPKGDAGGVGPQGAEGPKGDAGGVGDKGDTGDAGGVGPQGAEGPKGDAGDTGDKGDTGNKGADFVTKPWEFVSGAVAVEIGRRYIVNAGAVVTLPASPQGGHSVLLAPIQTNWAQANISFITTDPTTLMDGQNLSNGTGPLTLIYKAVDDNWYGTTAFVGDDGDTLIKPILSQTSFEELTYVNGPPAAGQYTHDTANGSNMNLGTINIVRTWVGGDQALVEIFIKPIAYIRDISLTITLPTGYLTEKLLYEVDRNTRGVTSHIVILDDSPADTIVIDREDNIQGHSPMQAHVIGKGAWVGPRPDA